jgi:ABC-2 type transport system ATP-binding protein
VARAVMQNIEQLRTLGKCIVFSTHIMREAERLCDRIAIIDHGKIIAQGTKDELVRRTLGKERLLSVESPGALPEPLRRRLAERGATLRPEGAVIPVEEPAREIPEVLALFRDAGAPVRDLTLKAATLEAVFLQLTGRELRE